MSGADLLSGLDSAPEPVDFQPSRAAGLVRLDQFVSRTGRHYAGQRNYDFGPEQRTNVSALSPWLRHRLITEEEVLRATLARNTPTAAEKFIQEVFWRTYFKGWLENRPSVWTAYLDGVDQAVEQLERDHALAIDYEDAIAGRIGIEGFDQWAQELVAKGYLHNHARMWFASIWVFTLRLPWELGADFFLRHLLDGDPASNTLGWRWVAGLHTKGKAYQARASNIAKYTEGRFRPEHQLVNTIVPLSETVEHLRQPLASADPVPEGDVLLLVTEEDCFAEMLLPQPPVGVLGVVATEGRSPLAVSPRVTSFARGAVADAVARAAPIGEPTVSAHDWATTIIAAAEHAKTRTVVTGYTPVGPVASRLAQVRGELEAAGLMLHQIRRPYDDLAWPHASKGFFALKKQIPRLLADLGLSA
ncbi:MAG: FAD-binding domain-containing protein [Pseudomonadota bacterium]